MVKRNIFITGAGGYVGTALLNDLAGKFDCVVYALTSKRLSPNVVEGNVRYIYCDDILSFQGWDLPKRVDVCIHLANIAHDIGGNFVKDEYWRVNVHGTNHIFNVLQSFDLKHFVYFSSSKVYGEKSQQEIIFQEDSDLAPVGAYALSKMEAERNLQENCQGKVRLSIIRPPLILGGHAKGNIALFSKILKIINVMPLASINNCRSYLSLPNLLDFIQILIFDEPKKNYNIKIFNISDDGCLSTPQLLRALAKSMNRSLYLFRCPPFFLEICGKLLRLSRYYNKISESFCIKGTNAKICYEWKPKHTTIDSIEKLEF